MRTWCGRRAVLANLLLALAAGAAPLSGAGVPGFDTVSLGDPEFARLQAAIRPGPERWMEIPWESDLGRARERSARERKPLLLWVMDGHPLGCT
jgi:hypothetical protein